MFKKLAAFLMCAAVAFSSLYVIPFSSDNFVITAEAASKKLAAPKNINKSATENSILFTWKKVEGASGYRVYIYNSSKKKYVKYKDVSSCKCTVKKLKAGTVYRFKIAALVKKNGKYYAQTPSSAITASTAAAVSSKTETNDIDLNLKIEMKDGQAVISKDLTVTSADLKNGVWNTEISNTTRGKNKSPELSWNAVEGATEYVVYMFDTSAYNWLHWKAYGITSTHLDPGSASETVTLKNQYIGPYPPTNKTHTYVITVIALKDIPNSYPGNFNTTNVSLDQIKLALNKHGSKSGNILAEASISGTYTAE